MQKDSSSGLFSHTEARVQRDKNARFDVNDDMKSDLFRLAYSIAEVRLHEKMQRTT